MIPATLRIVLGPSLSWEYEQRDRRGVMRTRVLDVAQLRVLLGAIDAALSLVPTELTDDETEALEFLS